MPILKKLENPLIAVVSVLIIVAFGFLGKLWYEIPLAALLSVTASALFSYLIASNSIEIINIVHKQRLTQLCFTICLFTTLCSLINFGKHSAYISGYFINGHVKKQNVFVEDDGEQPGHYVEKYVFIPYEKNAKGYMGIVPWGICAVYFTSIFITLKNYPKSEQADDKNNKRKYH
jgi:hypothetical protein